MIKKDKEEEETCGAGFVTFVRPAEMHHSLGVGSVRPGWDRVVVVVVWMDSALVYVHRRDGNVDRQQSVESVGRGRPSGDGNGVSDEPSFAGTVEIGPSPPSEESDIRSVDHELVPIASGLTSRPERIVKPRLASPAVVSWQRGRRRRRLL